MHSTGVTQHHSGSQWGHLWSPAVTLGHPRLPRVTLGHPLSTMINQVHSQVTWGHPRVTWGHTGSPGVTRSHLWSPRVTLWSLRFALHHLEVAWVSSLVIQGHPRVPRFTNFQPVLLPDDLGSPQGHPWSPMVTQGNLGSPRVTWGNTGSPVVSQGQILGYPRNDRVG